MTFEVKQFQVPKNGSEMHECQDAIACDVENGIYAIADGVSDSAFQQKWARLLVDSFLEKARTGEAFTKGWVTQWLETQQKVWQSQVDLNAIPWHGRMKAVQIGGEATFLGIRLKPDRRTWSGIVIGDCNLFHFDSNCAFIQSIPFQRSDEFSNVTQAFSSINKDHKQALSQVKVIEGKIKSGDYLLLATDAMAYWMLRQLEEKKSPLQDILAADDPTTFDHWVNAQRQGRKIKDDDTSLLMIQADPQKVKKPEPIPVTNGMTVERTDVQAVPKRRKDARISTSFYVASMLMILIVGMFVGSVFQSNQNSRRINENLVAPLVLMADKKQLLPETYKEVLLNYILMNEPVQGREVICKVEPAASVCQSGR